MTDIFVTGNAEDKELESLIKNRLSESYTVTYIYQNSFIRIGSGYNLIVLDSEKPVISTCGSVLLMKENGIIPEALPEDITAIINADSKAQLKAVQKIGIRAITCGTSSTSTISFSSETDDTLMISLNRSITALSGKIIQPLEIPVKKDGAERYSLMSYTTLRLILDNFNSELGKLI